jgi:hypothetical protein
MTKEQVLASLAANEITVDQAMKLLPTDKSPASGELSCKVSEKGAVSVYGLQRMPVTLYGGQWDRLLAFVPKLQAFLKEHASELSAKSADHKTIEPKKAA